MVMCPVHVHLSHAQTDQHATVNSSYAQREHAAVHTANPDRPDGATAALLQMFGRQDTSPNDPHTLGSFEQTVGASRGHVVFQPEQLEPMFHLHVSCLSNS